MRVSIGYSENPDTSTAGTQAALDALNHAGVQRRCDMVLLFTTSRHDAQLLHDAVASIVGHETPIVGGGSVGIITKDYLGYAGHQVGLAVFWFEGINCQIFAEPGLRQSEKATGERLGKRLAEIGTAPDSSVLLFYDSIDRTQGDPRLLMATPMLEGIEKGLGFLPKLVGAGMIGDYFFTPIKQWVGHGLGEHQAVALLFDGGLRIDSAIMHGCYPATGYYTVTKAEKQVILEINGQPALKFLKSILGSALKPEEYAFLIILGINEGEKWDDFHEDNYANRLVLSVDKERDGVVMFEPDMVEGTRFQIMHRSLNLDYIPPKIDELFASLQNRKLVFALYINCSGRAAGISGKDIEDGYVVQNSVRGRVPLLGIYSGVEIAPVKGRSRALDWTGIFCLFSVPE
ncbi:MAG: FIST C-terminal domain-containing protein [Azoarcus sp.]|jgi:hypothetical protein|nr:FIST C-terminal domain-containing protein [Azoarcus sp.]